MDSKLINKREMILNRHDAALEKWPDRNSAEFNQEIESVIEDLKHIIDAIKEKSGDRLERSKTHIYLGMALFDLAMGNKNNDKLKEKYFTDSAIAYERAEKLLLGIGDPLQAAKLNFNYANTLRGLSNGEDIGLLTAAKERYELALETFRSEAPQFMEQVTQTMSSIDTQINLAQLKGNITTHVNKLKTLQDKIREAEFVDKPLSDQAIKQDLDSLKQERPNLGDVSRQISDELGSFLKNYNHPIPPETSEIIQKQLESMNKISEQSANAQDDVEDFNVQVIFKLLIQRFENDIAEGKVSKLRQGSLKTILNDLKEMIDNQPHEINEMMDWTSKLRSMIDSMVHLMQSPSTGKPEPPINSRAYEVLKRIFEIKANLVVAINQPNLKDAERDTGYKLSIKCSEAELSLYEAGDDDQETLNLEKEIIRPLTLEIRNYLKRRRLMILNPYWGITSTIEKSGSILYNGDKQIKSHLKNICNEKNLDLISSPSINEYTKARWEQLQSCDVAIFSMSAKDKKQIAQYCYELGIARTLGKEVIILAKESDKLPFDIDITPLYYNKSQLETELSAALDKAILTAPQMEKDQSLDQTLAFIETKYTAFNDGSEIRTVLKQIKDADGDPIQVKSRLENLFNYVQGELPLIAYPAWQPFYTDEYNPRCFHVMPFSEKWSDALMGLVRKTCEQEDIEYIRGDEITDPNIIRSIWTEICKATHILVDITDLNPNVTLELGIAHCIGKKVMIICQKQSVDDLFPMIQKIRYTPYKQSKKEKKLKSYLTQFLRS